MRIRSVLRFRGRKLLYVPIVKRNSRFMQNRTENIVVDSVMLKTGLGSREILF